MSKRVKIDTEQWPEIEFFAQAVAALRKEQGISQKQLGELTGLDQAYISSLEGYFVNPTLQVQAKLARELGVPVSALAMPHPVRENNNTVVVVRGVTVKPTDPTDG